MLVDFYLLVSGVGKRERRAKLRTEIERGCQHTYDSVYGYVYDLVPSESWVPLVIFFIYFLLKSVNRLLKAKKIQGFFLKCGVKQLL
jgi:hypothetical protein